MGTEYTYLESIESQAYYRLLYKTSPSLLLEDEKVIAKDEYWSYNYALHNLKPFLKHLLY